MGQQITMKKAGHSASDAVYTALLDMVITRSSQGDLFLVEATLAEELGVSRTPVREALLRLRGDGLIEYVRHKGAIIPRITIEEVREIIEMRSMIEVFVVLNRAKGHSLDVESLRDAIRKQEASAKRGDLKRFIELDRQFHQGLVALAGNKLISDAYQSLRVRQLRLGLRAVAGSSQRPYEVVAEHAAIADAIVQEDPKAARTAIVRHLQKTRSAIETELGLGS
jgi:DNA-binding GntR family transcriptional regulator